MERHLNGLKVEFERFDAVDDKLLSSEELSRICARSDLPVGQIGCCLSHFGVYERIVARGISVACVLEDDGRLLPTAVRILRHGCSAICRSIHGSRFRERA